MSWKGMSFGQPEHAGWCHGGMPPKYGRCRIQNSEVESATRQVMSDPALPLRDKNRPAGTFRAVCLRLPSMAAIAQFPPKPAVLESTPKRSSRRGPEGLRKQTLRTLR